MMSLAMNIELSTDCRFADVLGCLEPLDPTYIDNEDDRVHATISNGLVSILAYVENPPSEVVTEGLPQQKDWLVGMRVSFQYRSAGYESAMRAARSFVEHMAARTQAEFILSFQYDSVYAIRDSAGLHFLVDF
ncbi:hypothetical protein [Cupriavidus sp. UGS-1]|uniref:hypothetical protein n=1 Tax=Cupriavidus sp. UGS-1 TaxID=2899826 RepID=UPI001E3E9733|nr:hypothetical protein [Cupriavidus sp. UGS-1]MCD9120885.1 hypothetical protein [Cupriavidus sp. UGS-1]